jgi:hypothetical protein
MKDEGAKNAGGLPGWLKAIRGSGVSGVSGGVGGDFYEAGKQRDKG